MKPGRLREIIVLQRRKEEIGEIGQLKTSWVDYAKVFCSVTYDMGTEAPKSRTEGEFELPANFIIRHRSDVKNTDRINYKGDIYTIEGLRVLDITRHRDAIELKGVRRG